MGLGSINPFRYKGYYYDSETIMYYCKSRYYVPQWCRWLNGDSVGYLNPQSINGLNMYAYCNNNPVMGIDPTEHAIISIILTIAGILAAGTINGYAAISGKGENESTFGAFLAGFIDGVIGTAALAAGVATGGALGFAIFAFGGFAGGFIGNAVGQSISYGNIHLGAALQGSMSAIININSFIVGNLMGLGSKATS